MPSADRRETSTIRPTPGSSSQARRGCRPKRGIVTEEHPIQTENGLRLFLTRRVTVLDDAGEPQYLIKTNEDITDRRETESRMAHMAYHDTLTGSAKPRGLPAGAGADDRCLRRAPARNSRCCRSTSIA
jgi:hypothetical protein